MDPRLFDAVENDNIPLVRNLLHQGFFINQRNHDGETPLFIAIANGNLPMVNLLIEYGADVDAEDYNRTSIMTSAVQMNRIDIVARLLDSGAYVNTEDHSPLEAAVYNGYSSMTQFLLEHGADTSFDANGESLLHIVSQKPVNWPESDYAQTLTILLETPNRYGSKLYVDPFDVDDNTPLAVAASYENLDLVQILLDHGADPDLIGWEELHIKPEIRDFIEQYSETPIKEPVEYN